jgi:hypothetical protein
MTIWLILLCFVVLIYIRRNAVKEEYRSCLPKLDKTCGGNKALLKTDCIKKGDMYGTLGGEVDGIYCPKGSHLKSLRFKHADIGDRITGIQAWCGEDDSCVTKEWRSLFKGDLSNWHKVILDIPSLPVRIITDKTSGELVYSPTNLMDIGILDLKKCEESAYNFFDVKTLDKIKGILWSSNNKFLMGIQFLYEGDAKCEIDSRLKVDVE